MQESAFGQKRENEESVYAEQCCPESQGLGHWRKSLVDYFFPRSATVSSHLSKITGNYLINKAMVPM